MVSAAELGTVTLNNFNDEPIFEAVDLPDHTNDSVDCIPETLPRPDSYRELNEGVDILEVAGHAFVYRIPRFPVVTIKLRQITFRTVLSDGNTVSYDGFIQDHDSLYGHVYPATIRVYESCFVEV